MTSGKELVVTSISTVKSHAAHNFIFKRNTENSIIIVEAFFGQSTVEVCKAQNTVRWAEK